MCRALDWKALAEEFETGLSKVIQMTTFEGGFKRSKGRSGAATDGCEGGSDAASRLPDRAGATVAKRTESIDLKGIGLSTLR